MIFQWGIFEKYLQDEDKHLLIKDSYMHGMVQTLGLIIPVQTNE